MSSWALGIAYNGKTFHGWQRQPNLPTVQGTLESAASQIADQAVNLTVAGRTDKGVHASAQVASFHTEAVRSEQDWLRGLNGLTTSALQVLWVKALTIPFHARYDAVSRTYNYVFVDNAPYGDVFAHDLAWCCEPLNVDAMHGEAQSLLGEHDFSSFRAAGCQSVSPMRRINRCVVRRQGPYVVLEIEANAFLLHMVRNIASALYDVGRHQRRGSITQLLALKDRAKLGQTAPAQGLYLTAVRYPRHQFPVSQPPRHLMGNSTFIPASQPLD